MISDILFSIERKFIDRLSKFRHSMIDDDAKKYESLRKRRSMSMFCFHCGKEFSRSFDLMVHLVNNPDCENYSVNYEDDKGTVLFWEIPKVPSKIPYDRELIIEQM